MRTRATLALVLLSLLLLPSVPASQPVHGQAVLASEFLPGVLLVGFEPGEDRGMVESLGSPVVALRMGDNVTYRMAVQPGQELATAEALRGRPGVAFAEPDYLVQALDTVEPNDPYWSQQWGPQAIGAPAAWSVVTGTRTITVAVVDSGIALAHPDLSGQIWTNPREVPANGLDDDGNGQVDDLHGWHFFHSWNGTQPVPQGDAKVEDDFGHGTHVAGIIGATGNNGVGISGLAWNITLMPVKVLDASGNGTDSEVAGGITYAVDNGARIINVSAGGPVASAVFCNAVAYARSRGCLVIASAGNGGETSTPGVLYPAACPGALAVAATGRNGQRSSYSSYGPQVALAAPGDDIYSTWPWVSGYFTKTGTSMAAPHVSGVAALVWSRWPGWPAFRVSRQMTATAVDLGSLGQDEYTGWGRVDAAASVASEVPAYPVYFPSVSR